MKMKLSDVLFDDCCISGCIHNDNGSCRNEDILYLIGEKIKAQPREDIMSLYLDCDLVEVENGLCDCGLPLNKEVIMEDYGDTKVPRETYYCPSCD